MIQGNIFMVISTRITIHGVVRQVSMNDMAETIMTFEDKKLSIKHIPGPEGVRGRNSENSVILEKLGWEPTIKLKDGLR
jgi:GDP-D-mannose 3', 5'-epimerase